MLLYSLLILLSLSLLPPRKLSDLQISGFDRFAGVEGLRGCCLLRAVTSDRFPLVRTSIPGPLQYPIKVRPPIFKIYLYKIGLDPRTHGPVCVKTMSM